MGKQKHVAITTIDNPYNPLNDYINWFNFDVEKGYYTASKLARISVDRRDLTESEEIQLIESEIDRLIEIDPLKIYKKIVIEE